MRMPCPCCNAPTWSSKHDQVSPLYRRAYFQCQNPACGWRGIGHLAIDRTISAGESPPRPSRAPTLDEIEQFLSSLMRIRDRRG